ncbi:hypothetical protein ACIRD3_40300 [Kitasatospora sp. NPDC093550]|uniref:hypothetical protein n=1 Tax=Kitasatospora sp. NPDC093550 TaxID=3364089 RepID=UPI00382CFF13
MTDTTAAITATDTTAATTTDTTATETAAAKAVASLGEPIWSEAPLRAMVGLDND